MVGLEHPGVAAYLARLRIAAASLPAGRRDELLAEIRGHLADSLGAATGAESDDIAVAAALDRIGTPEEIVAAENGPGSSLAGPSQAAAQASAPPSSWGPLEVTAVIGLIAGTLVLPVVGPLIGVVCAWLSPRWSARDKTVATVLALLPVIVLAIGVVALGVLRVTGTAAAGVPR